MDTDPRPRATVLAILATASAVASLAAMVWFARSIAGLLSWFTIWVLSPSIVALALARLMPERFRSWPLLALAGLALLFGPFAYTAVALGSPDAQNALVFAIVPFWQLLGLAVAWLAALVVGALARRRARA